MENLLSTRVEPILPTPVYEELRRLAVEGKGRVRRQASVALKLAERCRIVPVETKEGETVDDLLVRLAGEWGCPVATNDRELRRRLRRRGVPTIFLRDLSHLEVEGHVE